VCWAWVANLILLHNFKVFALEIKRGTKARVSPASLKFWKVGNRYAATVSERRAIPRG
jgi:hypothetical protein